MGGTGGDPGGPTSKGEAERLRADILRQLEEQELEAELNAFLAERLASYNDRDTDLVRDRLEEIQRAISDLTVDLDRLLFGGSVAKHTYVDGLSDIDALVVINESEATPGDLLERFWRALKGRLGTGDVADVSAGRLAVTVTYRDGTQVQLLPAVERSGHTMIAAEDGSTWRQIRPHKFAEKLTEVNRANGRAVVPTIKLAKAAMAQLPEFSRLSGYHVEAIAVDAFKAYSGRRDRLSMLNHLLDHASRAVLRPTGDITGQSVHIDSDLGPANSAQRGRVSREIAKLARDVGTAHSVNELRAIFDD